MAKEIVIKINIPNWRQIIRLAMSKTKKIFSWLFFYFRQASLRVVTDVVGKKWRGLFVLAFSTTIYLYGGLAATLTCLLFLLFLVYEWENRVIAFLALLSLVACPFLIYFKKEDLAEGVAVYAYYFLVMTVVLQIVEFKLEQRRDRKLKNIWFK